MSGTGETVLGEEAREALVAAFQPHVDVPGAWVDRVAPTVAALVAQARADAELQATRETWRKAHADRDEMVADFMARIKKAHADGAAEERERCAVAAEALADEFGVGMVDEQDVRDLAVKWRAVNA